MNKTGHDQALQGGSEQEIIDRRQGQSPWKTYPLEKPTISALAALISPHTALAKSVPPHCAPKTSKGIKNYKI